MNILMLTSDFYPNIGGIASHIYYLSKELSQNNNVYVYFISGSLSNKKYSIGKVKIYRENISKLKIFYYVDVIRISIKILHLINRKKITVINYHTLFPDCLIVSIIRLLNKDIRIVFTNHSSGFIEIYNNSRKLSFLKKVKYKFYLYLFGKAADCIICPSKELEKISHIIYRKKNVNFIPNGVDINIFKPKKVIGKKNSFNILIPRRLAPKNGVIYGIKSIAYLSPSILKKVKFYIAGDNNDFIQEKKKIEKFLSDGNYLEYVEFMGAIDNNKMEALYNSADIVLIPSLIEAVSISALEAMSCGKPIIASNTGGLPFIVRHGYNGFLTEPKNSKEIAYYIEKLFKMKNNENDAFLQFGKNSRDLIENHFSWTIIAKKILIRYREC